MAESEELKSLLMRVKEESKKAGLELSIQKSKTVASGPITLWQIEGGKVEAATDFTFLAIYLENSLEAGLCLGAVEEDLGFVASVGLSYCLTP